MFIFFGHKSAYLTGLAIFFLTNTDSIGPGFRISQVSTVFGDFRSKMLENLLDVFKTLIS